MTTVKIICHNAILSRLHTGAFIQTEVGLRCFVFYLAKSYEVCDFIIRHPFDPTTWNLCDSTAFSLFPEVKTFLSKFKLLYR